MCPLSVYSPSAPPPLWTLPRSLRLAVQQRGLEGVGETAAVPDIKEGGDALACQLLGGEAIGLPLDGAAWHCSAAPAVLPTLGNLRHPHKRKRKSCQKGGRGGALSGHQGSSPRTAFHTAAPQRPCTSTGSTPAPTTVQFLKDSIASLSQPFLQNKTPFLRFIRQSLHAPLHLQGKLARMSPGSPFFSAPSS